MLGKNSLKHHICTKTKYVTVVVLIWFLLNFSLVITCLHLRCVSLYLPSVTVNFKFQHSYVTSYWYHLKLLHEGHIMIVTKHKRCVIILYPMSNHIWVVWAINSQTNILTVLIRCKEFIGILVAATYPVSTLLMVLGQTRNMIFEANLLTHEKISSRVIFPQGLAEIISKHILIFILPLRLILTILIYYNSFDPERRNTPYLELKHEFQFYKHEQFTYFTTIHYQI